MLTPTLPEQYIGQLLYFDPGGSPNWKLSNAVDHLADEASDQVISGFHVRVRYFLTHYGRDAWGGLVGTVEEESHIFDQFWIGCSVNYSGYPDFTDHLRFSHCSVGPNRPRESRLLCPSGFPVYSGKGILAENQSAIAEALAAKQLFGSFYG